MDGFKLWYSGGLRDRNEVGILVDADLREQVVEVRRINDRMMMMIKLVVGGLSVVDKMMEERLRWFGHVKRRCADAQ